MQEKTLFEEIRNGYIEMFGILFKKYFGSMCVIAKSFISDTQAAEDIVQDIFIRLWEKRREYEEIPNLQVFLYVLVKNRCMDFLRSKKNTIEYTETELIYQAETFQDLVQEEELPVQSAKIMRLTLDGKQNKEISEILNISVNSVKTLKYNALHTMRSRLEEKYYLLLWLFINKI